MRLTEHASAFETWLDLRDELRTIADDLDLMLRPLSALGLVELINRVDEHAARSVRMIGALRNLLTFQGFLEFHDTEPADPEAGHHETHLNRTLLTRDAADTAGAAPPAHPPPLPAVENLPGLPPKDAPASG